MCCTDVSCWHLQVFLEPQSMNKNRSCFFCAWTLAEKTLQKYDKIRTYTSAARKRTKKDFVYLCKKQ